MSETVSLEQDDVNTVFQSLNASKQMTCWLPAKCTFQTVDWFACTVEGSFTTEYSDHAAMVMNQIIDCKECAVTTP